MLDIKYIRENVEVVKKSTSAKNYDAKIVDDVLDLDEKRRKLIDEIGSLRAERNKAAKNKDIEAGKRIKKELKENEPGLKEIEERFTKAMWGIPNVIAEDVHEGKDDEENKILRTWGEPTKFDFDPKDHMDLGLALGIIETDKSAKISGSRFNFLFGGAVLLQFALVQFVMQTLTDREIIKNLADSVGNEYDTPFIPVIPPVIAKAEIMKKMDRFDPIDDRYYLEQDDSLLVGSAEHTLGPLHMEEILNEKDLPIRYIGYSTAFRREAGTYGKDTRGILRRHQFDKLEMESFAMPEQGQKEQDLFVAIQEYFMQQLELPHQVMMICTGDMGKPDYRQIDIETWMPGQNKYRETHTSDYMTDYQARRLDIRFKGKGGSKGMVHMNDATAMAVGRGLIAIIENYQQKDGSIRVPKVLQKWVGKEVIK